MRPKGIVLHTAYWGVLGDSRAASAERYASGPQSHGDPANSLDTLPWEEAVKQGGPTFTYEGTRFALW